MCVMYVMYVCAGALDLPIHGRESAAAMSRWSDGSFLLGSGPSTA